MRLSLAQPHQLAQKTLVTDRRGHAIVAQCRQRHRRVDACRRTRSRCHLESRACCARRGTLHVRCQVVPEKLAAEVATLQQSMLRLLDTDTSRAIIEPDFAKWMQATYPCILNPKP